MSRFSRAMRGALFCAALLFIPAGEVRAGYASPEEAAQALARAIKEKDWDAFQKAVDVAALLDASYARDYAASGRAGEQHFIGREREKLMNGIASGEYNLACSKSQRPGCPWYAEGIAKAALKKSSSGAAVLAVDNKEDIRSWLILRDLGQGWVVAAETGRLGYAEFYSGPDFIPSLTAWRQAETARKSKSNDRQARYDAELAKAKEKCLGFLKLVAITDIVCTVVQGPTSESMEVRAVARNANTSPVRLFTMEMAVTDQKGVAVKNYSFSVNSQAMAPGASLPITLSSRLSTEREKELARNLANGTYRAKATAVHLFMDNKNIDKDGGSLKPSWSDIP